MCGPTLLLKAVAPFSMEHVALASLKFQLATLCLKDVAFSNMDIISPTPLMLQL